MSLIQNSHQDHKSFAKDWILVVDDLRDFGQKNFEGKWYVYARTVPAALSWLRQYEFPQVWLDHDLGINPETKQEEDIRPVVRYLETIVKHGGYAPKVKILTVNPVGRQYIQQALGRNCELI